MYHHHTAGMTKNHQPMAKPSRKLPSCGQKLHMQQDREMSASVTLWGKMRNLRAQPRKSYTEFCKHWFNTWILLPMRMTKD